MRLLFIIGYIFISFISLLTIPAKANTGLENAIQSTLVVYTNTPDPEFLGSAFGYATKSGDHVITNAHVTKDHQTVLLKTNKGNWIKADVVRKDEKRDLAMLYPHSPLPAVFSASVEQPTIGRDVFAIGAPLQHEFTLSSGIISATGVFLDPSVPVKMIRHDAAINPGSSGGPLISKDGHVLGVNSNIADGSRMFVGIGYAIPIATVNAFIEEKLPFIPDLGITIRPITAQIASAISLDTQDGLLIEDVTQSGWAASIGLMAGDIIIGIDDIQIVNTKDIATALDVRTSDTLTISIQRDEQVLDIDGTVTNTSHPNQEMPKPTAKQPSTSLYELGARFISGTAILEAVAMSEIAYQNGLTEGDQILAWNSQSIKDVDVDSLPTRSISNPVLLLIKRQERTLHIVFDPNLVLRLGRPLGGGNILDPDVITF